MTSIRERTHGDGSKAYLVQITRRKAGVSESRQVDKRKTAETWAKNRERENDEDITAGGQSRPGTRSASHCAMSVSFWTIPSTDHCRVHVRDRRHQGSGPANCSEGIDIADMRSDEIEPKHFVAFVLSLNNRPDLTSASTAGRNLLRLSGVISFTRCGASRSISKPSRTQRKSARPWASSANPNSGPVARPFAALGILGTEAVK